MAYAVDPTAETTTQSSSFLTKLKPEIRAHIYRFVLVSKEEIIVRTYIVRGQRAILHTCKKIRAEASHIFYNENKFRILPNLNHQPRHLWATKFFKAAGRENASRVKILNITFGWTTKENRLSDKAIAAGRRGVKDADNKRFLELFEGIQNLGWQYGSDLIAVGVPITGVSVERVLPLASFPARTLYIACSNEFEHALLCCWEEYRLLLQASNLGDRNPNTISLILGERRLQAA